MTIRVQFLDHVIGVTSNKRRHTVTFNLGEVAEISEKQWRAINRLQKRTGKRVMVDFKSHLETWWCPICSKRFVASARRRHNKTFHKELVEIHVCFEPGCGRPFTTKRSLALHQGHVQHGRFGDSRFGHDSPDARQTRLLGQEFNQG